MRWPYGMVRLLYRSFEGCSTQPCGLVCFFKATVANTEQVVWKRVVLVAKIFTSTKLFEETLAFISYPLQSILNWTLVAEKSGKKNQVLIGHVSAATGFLEMAFAFWHLPLHTGALPLPERPRLAAAVDFWRLPLFFGSKKWLTSRQELETNHSVVWWNNQIISTWLFFVVIFVCNVKCCTLLSKSTLCRDKPTSPPFSWYCFQLNLIMGTLPRKSGPPLQSRRGGSFHQLWW